eukprot:c24760_g3_i1 orf=277-720(+)
MYDTLNDSLSHQLKALDRVRVPLCVKGLNLNLFVGWCVPQTRRLFTGSLTLCHMSFLFSICNFFHLHIPSFILGCFFLGFKNREHGLKLIAPRRSPDFFVVMNQALHFLLLLAEDGIGVGGVIAQKRRHSVRFCSPSYICHLIKSIC